MAKAANRAKRRNNTVQNPVREEEVFCWDELKGLHRYCVELLSTPAPIATALSNRDIVSKCKDAGVLVHDARLLKQDMEVYSQRLQAILASHSDKSGGTDDPDQLMEALDIGEQYQQWIDSFQSVVVPTVQAISANLLNAEEIESDEDE